MSLYAKLVEYMELSEGRPMSPENQRRTLAHQKGLEHRGFTYYGKKGGNGPITHKLVTKGPNDVGTFVPVDKTDLAKYNKQSKSETEPTPSSPKQKIKPGKAKSPKQTNEPAMPMSKTPLADSLVQMGVPPEKLTDQQKTALRRADIGKSQNAMLMTKQQADTLPEEERKDVGAGNHISRAGECVVTNTLRDIIIGIKSDNLTGRKAVEFAQNHINVEMERLMELADDGRHILERSWINSGRIVLNQLVSSLGPELSRIDEVTWDTPYGRQLIGTQDHGTSADFFIKMKNGARVGVSLKKDSRIIMANLGLTTLVDKLGFEMKHADSSEENVSEVNRIIRLVSGEKKNSQYGDDMKMAVATAQKTLKKRPELLREAKQTISGLLAGKIPHDKDNANILPYLKAMQEKGTLNNLFDKENITQKEMKVLQRVFYYMQAGKYGAQAEQLNRSFYEPRERLSERFLDLLKNNEMLSNAMKNNIIQKMHLYECLGIGIEQHNMEGFMTLYGDGNAPQARMDEESITELFGADAKNFAKLVDLSKNAPTDAAKMKARLEVDRLIKERIVVDFAGSKGKGVIKYTRTNPSPPPPLLSYTFFNLEVKVKGIDGAPQVVMIQSPAFIYALEYGTDASKWPGGAKNTYYMSEYESAMDRAMDAAPGGAKDGANKMEMEELRKNIQLDDRKFAMFVARTQAKLEKSRREDE